MSLFDNVSPFLSSRKNFLRCATDCLRINASGSIPRTNNDTVCVDDCYPSTPSSKKQSPLTITEIIFECSDFAIFSTVPSIMTPIPVADIDLRCASDCLPTDY